MTAATKLLAPLDLGQLERDLQAKVQYIRDLHDRLESEIALRLYYQHQLAARGGYFKPWHLAEPEEQKFWHRMGAQQVAETL